MSLSDWIPTPDFSELEEEGREAFQSGIVIVKGIDPGLVERVYTHAVPFFASPQKEWYPSGETSSGYHPCISKSEETFREAFFLVPSDISDGIQGHLPAIENHFPDFFTSLMAIYSVAEEIYRKVAMQDLGRLTCFYYQQGRAPWKKTEHPDPRPLVAFPAQGEPLEFYCDGWRQANLEPDQALVLRAGIRHRVQNTSYLPRLSVVGS